MFIINQVLLFVLFHLMIIDVTAKQRIVKLQQTNLDIALLFEEYVSIKRTNYKQVYDGLKQWISETLDRSNQTRFAILGCGYSKPRLLLRNGTNAENVIKQFPADNIKGPRCNVQQSLTTVLDVFEHYNGDRHQSQNVLLFITDCVLGTDRDNAIENVAKKIRKEIAFFGIICLQMCDRGKCGLMNENSRPTIVKWLGHDENKLITFTNSSNFRHYLDTVLSTVDVEVEDCEYTNESLGCTFNLSTNRCENIFRRFISIRGSSAGYAVLCTKNKSESVVTVCSESECACDIYPWVNETCSVSCGDGIQTSRRNVSHNPTCSNTETWPCYVKCNINSTVTRNETETIFYRNAIGMQYPYTNTTIVIVLAVGIAVLLVLLFVIFVMLLRRRGSFILGRGKKSRAKFFKTDVSSSDDTREMSIELKNDFETSSKTSTVNFKKDHRNGNEISEQSLIAF